MCWMLLRGQADVRAVVVVTTDKVYRNREWAYPTAKTTRWAATTLQRQQRRRPRSSPPATAMHF